MTAPTAKQVAMLKKACEETRKKNRLKQLAPEMAGLLRETQGLRPWGVGSTLAERIASVLARIDGEG
jgi:hypothetical protein